MKIRITQNKIRLRLKSPEIQRLYEGVLLSECLVFGPDPSQQLYFQLETYDEAHLDISYRPGSVVIHMPKLFSETLATTNKVSYESDIVVQGNTSVYILIEKDFECLDDPDADNEGAYPNPKQVC